jgi:Tol biopolymer transport system component
MNSTDARQLADMDGAFAWSPDSRSIAGMAPGGKLVRVEIVGGAPQVISTPGHVILVTWGRQDVLLLSTVNGLLSVASTGGAPKQVDPKGHAASNPAFLPDGGRFIHNKRRGGLEVFSLNSNEASKPLFGVPQTNIAFAPMRDQQTGYLLYMRGEALKARPFNAATLELGMEEVTLVNGVAVGGSGIGYFSVAEEGTLAYRVGSRERVATLFDRSGKVLGVFPGINSVALAPDGKRFAAAVQGDIWIVDMQKNTTQRFSEKGSNAVWSPDGQNIVFRKGKDLFIKPSNGAHDEQLLFESQENKEAVHWSRDGRYILFTATGQNTPSELWYLDRTTNKAVLYLKEQGGVSQGQFSPDGKFVAYQSDESGQPEIYVRTFPGAEGRWLISRGGGFTPRWRPDGKEIFFRGEQTSYRSVDVLLGAGVEIGQQHEWFNAEGAGADYDVMPDGNRFLVRTLAPETLAGPITIALNWPALLKKQ